MQLLLQVCELFKFGLIGAELSKLTLFVNQYAFRHWSVGNCCDR
jgi:hypothetical protein